MQNGELVDDGGDTFDGRITYRARVDRVPRHV